MPKPIVIKDECTACETCVDECPEGAITMVDDVAVINYEKCNECGTCVDSCPSEAIKMPEE